MAGSLKGGEAHPQLSPWSNGSYARGHIGICRGAFSKHGCPGPLENR